MSLLSPSVINNLNALTGGLFLIAAFGIVATRQMLGCLRFYVAQSVALAVSAFLLGLHPFSRHLMEVCIITIISKPILIPWVLKKTMGKQVYTRREISQVLNIPTSLLIAMVLAILAYFLATPLIHATGDSRAIVVNLPIGLAGVLLGTYTLAVRREALPQLLGLLAMENGAFFAGIVIAPDLPAIAELAVTFDVLILALVVGVLTRAIAKHIGTTEVGELASLKEDASL